MKKSSASKALVLFLPPDNAEDASQTHKYAFFCKCNFVCQHAVLQLVLSTGQRPAELWLSSVITSAEETYRKRNNRAKGEEKNLFLKEQHTFLLILTPFYQLWHWWIRQSNHMQMLHALQWIHHVIAYINVYQCITCELYATRLSFWYSSHLNSGSGWKMKTGT